MGLRNTEYFTPYTCKSGLFDKDSEEIRAWLNSIIGRKNWQYHGVGSRNPNCIRFETREDALAFKLKFEI